MPGLTTVGLLVDPLSVAAAATLARDVRQSAEGAGIKAVVVEVSGEHDLELAFARLVEERVGALVFAGLVFFNRYRDRMVALTVQHRIPSIFSNRVFPDAGGLMSYGSSIPDAFHQVGIYTGQILKGAKPAELPVRRPTKLRLVFNLKAAKALGLDVPPTVLARADEVIE